MMIERLEDHHCERENTFGKYLIFIYNNLVFKCLCPNCTSDNDFRCREMVRIIQKVWGEEHWIVNREYAGKKMVLYKGKQCSLHFHKKKDETFHVIKGKVLLECMGERRIMIPGDTQLILVLFRN